MWCLQQRLPLPHWSFQLKATLLQPSEKLLKKNRNVRLYHPWSSLTDGHLHVLWCIKCCFLSPPGRHSSTESRWPTEERRGGAGLKTRRRFSIANGNRFKIWSPSAKRWGPTENRTPRLLNTECSLLVLGIFSIAFRLRFAPRETVIKMVNSMKRMLSVLVFG